MRWKEIVERAVPAILKAEWSLRPIEPEPPVDDAQEPIGAASAPKVRINHGKGYSIDGACTNMAESYFSRLRRAEIGVHHHIAGPYLHAYATEMSWREDRRTVGNGEQVVAITSTTLRTPQSRQWAGYWQRAA